MMTPPKPDHIAHRTPSPCRESDSIYLVEKSNTDSGSWLTFAHQNSTATGIIITNRSRANEPSQPRNSNSSYVFMFASGGACSCCRANQYRVPFAEPVKSTEVSFQARKISSCLVTSVGAYGRPRSKLIANWQGLQALPTGRRANGCAAVSIRRQASLSPSWWRSRNGINGILPVRDHFPAHSKLPGRVPTREQHARGICFNIKASVCRGSDSADHPLLSDNRPSKSWLGVGLRPRQKRRGAETARKATNSGVGKSGPLIRCGEGGRVDTCVWACAGIFEQRGVA